MRVLVYVRPIHVSPFEQMPMMMEQFAAWRERYRSQMEVFEFFAGSQGGIGIVHAADEASLNQMMMEYPFAPFSDIDVKPIVNGDVALAQWREAMKQMAGA